MSKRETSQERQDEVDFCESEMSGKRETGQLGTCERGAAPHLRNESGAQMCVGWKPVAEPQPSAPSVNQMSEVHPREDPLCGVCGAVLTPIRFKCLSCGQPSTPAPTPRMSDDLADALYAADLSASQWKELNGLMPVGAPASAGPWISVEERLPELTEHDGYATVLAYDRTWDTQYLASYHEDHWVAHEDREPPQVTHWMPLPAAPESA